MVSRLESADRRRKWPCTKGALIRRVALRAARRCSVRRDPCSEGEAGPSACGRDDRAARLVRERGRGQGPSMLPSFLPSFLRTSRTSRVSCGEPITRNGSTIIDYCQGTVLLGYDSNVGRGSGEERRSCGDFGSLVRRCGRIGGLLLRLARGSGALTAQTRGIARAANSRAGSQFRQAARKEAVEPIRQLYFRDINR